MKAKRPTAETAKTNDDSDTDTQQQATNPTPQELQRIGEIARELNSIQERQAQLIQELRDLLPDQDPEGVEWIYPEIRN